MSKSTAKKQGPEFRGQPDLKTLREVIRYIDKTTAVTWTGQGGVKERLEAVLREHDTAEKS